MTADAPGGRYPDPSDVRPAPVVTADGRTRKPTDSFLLADCLTGLTDDAYTAVRSGMDSVEPKPDDPERLFRHAAEEYAKHATNTARLRRLIDVLVKVLQWCTPVALLAGLLALGAPSALAVLAAALCLGLLVSPCWAAGEYRTLMRSAPFAALIGLAGYAVLAGVGTTAIGAVGHPTNGVILGLGVVTLTATAVLTAVMSVHWLRRHRRCLAGYFLLQRPRDEIVSELAQVLLLLEQMVTTGEWCDRRTAIAREKLGRVRYLFRRAAVFAAVTLPPVDRRRSVQGCRRIARRLQTIDSRIEHVGRKEWEAARPELSALAAVVLVHANDRITGHDAAVLARRERLRAHVLRGLKVATVAALLVGAALGYRALELPDSPIVAVLVGLSATVVKQLVDRHLRGDGAEAGPAAEADLRTTSQQICDFLLRRNAGTSSTGSAGPEAGEAWSELESSADGSEPDGSEGGARPGG